MFVQALVLSFESIFVELLTDLPRISALLVSSVSIPIAGAISLLIPFIYERKITVFNSSKLLIAGSIILAAAVFLWYDSVSRVGASKEGLLAGPLETVVVLNLAWLLLKEKLVKTQLVGVIIALSGFFAAALSQSSQLNSPLVVVITFGDVEAMVSAVAFAAGVIIMTRLVERHTPVEVSGASLLISGLILAGILVLSRVQVSTPSVPQWIYLITFSLLPLFAALLYVIGLNRIGASLTSTIASSNMLLTILLQLVLKEFGIKGNLPENITLAILGGVIGFVGIYFIHSEKDILFRRT